MYECARPQILYCHENKTENWMFYINWYELQ